MNKCNGYQLNTSSSFPRHNRLSELSFATDLCGSGENYIGEDNTLESAHIYRLDGHVNNIQSDLLLACLSKCVF